MMINALYNSTVQLMSRFLLKTILDTEKRFTEILSMDVIGFQAVNCRTNYLLKCLKVSYTLTMGIILMGLFQERRTVCANVMAKITQIVCT